MKKNVFTLMLLLPATSQAVDVSTSEEFVAAIRVGGNVVLTDDLTLPESQVPVHVYPSDLTIDGQGHKIDGGDNQHQFIRFMPGSEVNEIKNITFQNIVNKIIPNGENGTKLDPDDNQGGAISNYGHIKSIDANFYNNQAFNGGAINNGGHIESINGEFKGNKAWGGETSSGAVIYNNGWGSNAVIDNITGLFEDNLGGYHAAIWNGNGTINNISATFQNNHRSSIGSNAGVTNISNSKFYKNTSEGIDGVGQAGSGIIYYGSANINVKDSIFEENYALWKGAAIAGTDGSGNLTISGSKFINNSAGEEGGAIYTNSIGKVDISDSVFTGNRGNWGGGAIYNGKATYTITGSTFDNNRTGWYGGIYNGGTMDIANSVITNNFANGGGAGIGNSGVLKITDTEIANNKIEYWEDIASGGGIQSSKGSLSVTGGSIHDNSASSKGGAVYISGGEATLTSVDIKGNKSGKGGAVHSLVDLTMAADDKDMLVVDNNKDTNQIGVFMETENTTLNLNTANGGNVLFDDIVDGDNYNIKISGDESGRVEFHNQLNNVKTLTMAEGGTLYLGKEQKLSVQNLTGKNGTLWLDAETDFDSNTLKNGMLEVGKDVSGNTNVIVNFLNTAETENPEDVFSPFVTAANDDKTTDASFKVNRVISSPYMWETRYNVKGDEEGSVWYLGIQKKENPTNPDPKPDDSVYAPEVAAYAGIQSAAIEQNRGLADSVARGIAPEKSAACYEESCGVAEAIVKKKVWIDVVHENSESTAPVDMDAKVQGVTVGLDIYADDEHRAGLFGSYRNGKYDLSGKGDYFSNVGSDIKTNSYLGGLYYQYKRNNWKMLGTLFAGKQDIDITTDDKIVSASTDAMQYGASAEVSKKLAIAQYLNLEPSLGLRYTMTDIDSLSDKVGKRVNFDVLHFAEVELGAKLEYLFCREGCTNRLYAKPSVIQTFVKGGKTQITGLHNEVKSIKSQTLGRLEIGGEFGLSNSLSGYAATGYTFGEDYSAYDVNLGLNYAF